jgi:hypothetical protein
MIKLVNTLKDASKAERKTQTKMDTVEVSPEILKKWKHAPFQRTLVVNHRVQAVAEKIKIDGVIPGILTLGVLDGETYIVDGQHRCEGFLMSGIKVGYADVRYHWFESMAEMAKEFEELNSSLVNWKPDDILRAREAHSPGLQELRRLCPFIGYTMIRRGGTSPLISMSAVLRCWFGSETEVPAAGGGKSARSAAERLTIDEARSLAAFMAIAFEAFGRDEEFYRLWGNLTLSLSMWLYRRTVTGQYSPATTRLTREQFRSCLSAMTTDERHLEFLIGRGLNDTSRAPTYNRMKAIFSKRLEQSFGKTKTGAAKLRLPAPSWAHA